MFKYILLHVHHPAGRKSLIGVSVVFAGAQAKDHVEDRTEECKAEAEQYAMSDRLSAMIANPHTVDNRDNSIGTASPASVYPLMFPETNAEMIPAANTIQKYEVFHAIL